jgi:hypothetical protein
MIRLFSVVCISLAVGIAISLASEVIIWAGLISFLIIIWFRTSRDFRLWQHLTYLALIGYSVLNYGFANWAIYIWGISLPFGHLMIFFATSLVLGQNLQYIKPLFREPIILCWISLLIITLAHLSIDFSRFGYYAIRDASFVFEGFFIVLGYAWAKELNGMSSFLRTLSGIFFLNLLYSLTFAVRYKLISISPLSGIFFPVPIVGFYTHTPFFLVLGGLYYVLLGRQTAKIPNIIYWTLALLQFGWSFAFQVRSVYLCLILSIFVLIIFSNTGTVIKAITGSAMGIIFLLALVTTFGIEIPGRLGYIAPDFFLHHFKSIFLVPETPALGSIHWRLELFSEIWARWSHSLASVCFGEGFGRPLIDFTLFGVMVRQPHNTHITFLMRLGLLGLLLWILMNLRITFLFLTQLSQYSRGSDNHNLAIWLFLFYISGLVLTTFQPWLEFSYGAVPFFVFLGFAVGTTQKETPTAKIQISSK